MVIRFEKSANTAKINTVIDDFSNLFVPFQTIVLNIISAYFMLRK